MRINTVLTAMQIISKILTISIFLQKTDHRPFKRTRAIRTQTKEYTTAPFSRLDSPVVSLTISHEYNEIKY